MAIRGEKLQRFESKCLNDYHTEGEAEQRQG